MEKGKKRMNLSQQITKDLMMAKKTGEKKVGSVLIYLKSLLTDNSKEKNPIPEINVLNGHKKKMIKSLELYKDYPEKIQEINEEIKIINTYLPEELSEEKIKEIINEVIAAIDIKDFKIIMPAVMSQLKGKADGKLVQDFVRAALQ